MDSQPKRFVDIINRLHRAMQGGKGKQAVGKILEELLLSTQAHFRAEEEAVESCGYSEPFVLHVENERRAYAMMELHEKLTSSELALGDEVNQFLKKWLDQHLQSVVPSGPLFLKGKGGK